MFAGELEQRVVEAAAHALAAMVAAAFRVGSERLKEPQRGSAEVALARQVAIYLLRTRLHMSYEEAGACFARDRTTAAHACYRIEERREDPGFDTLIDCLELAIGTVAPGGRQ
jgi:chromosomal replication initiation ATPase DnaA